MIVTTSCKPSLKFNNVCIFVGAMGIAGAVGAWWATKTFPGIDIKEIGSVFASVSGTLLGFLIAALSILATVLDRTLLQNMRKSGHLEVLMNELHNAGIAFLIVLLLAFGILFSDGDSQKNVAIVAGGAMSAALTLLARAGNKFIMVMMNIR